MTAAARPVGALATVVLDTDDLAVLAGFWSAVLGLEIVGKDDEWWQLAPLPGGASMAFQKVGKHRPPNASRPQQLHLDIKVDDVAVAEERVLALGAEVRSELHPGDGSPWRVYADPAGHPFCLVTS